ncbi:MAG: MBL fold metallo-hydrolase [Clostridia bacterium]|nr:MBL fold metallo-hydrolase [Clostridia bacterium]
MEIENLYPGSWGSNCYLLTSGSHAALVDPSANASTLLNAVAQKGAVLDFILLTHGHFDHIVSIDVLRQYTDAPVMIHEHDAEMLGDATKNAFYTFFRQEKTYRAADRELSDGETLMLGTEPIRVLHTPGHSPGSVCYLCNDEFLLTGDTLFDEGVGRCDLWKGDADRLKESLAKLRTYPQNLPIYPGHGAPARLGIALDMAAYLI